MTKAGSIQLKAAFLLVAFGLNTVIGFACSIDVNMGFNSKGHHDEEATEAVVHIHDDGKKHIHYEKKQDHSKSHHHDEENNDKSKSGKDNCCTDKVQQVEKLDKSLPHSLTILHPIFLIAFFDVFYNVSLPANDIVKDIKQFVRSYHPPIPDIRIAIQSFQI
jgi:hypothetical protein